MAFRLRESAVLFIALIAIAGCSDVGPGTPLDGAPIAAEAIERHESFQHFEVHFSATRTDTVPAEFARAYGITRSKTRALLNVVMLDKRSGEPYKPVPGTVSAKTSNLTGQLKNIELREVREGDAVYYLGEVSVSDEEILNFAITAKPAGENKPLEVKFQQQFFTD